MIEDDDVVTGIIVPTNNKGNPMPAIAIGTIPLCTIGRGMIANNTRVNAIINLEIIELLGIDDIESKISATDKLTKSKSNRLNRLIASRRY